VEAATGKIKVVKQKGGKKNQRKSRKDKDTDAQ